MPTLVAMTRRSRPPRAASQSPITLSDSPTTGLSMLGDQPPTASFTHFFVNDVLAAPASFFCAAVASQVAVASRWHLPRKLVLAAPASFLSVALEVQVASAWAAERPASRV